MRPGSGYAHVPVLIFITLINQALEPSKIIAQDYGELMPIHVLPIRQVASLLLLQRHLSELFTEPFKLRRS